MKTLNQLREISNPIVNEEKHTDVASAKKSIALIHQFASDIESKLEEMRLEESLPSSWMGKVHEAKMRLDDAAKYITNSVEESFRIQESVIDQLKSITTSKKDNKVKLEDGSTVDVDPISASAIVKTYNALNGQNKKKMEDSLSKDEVSFVKILDFAFDNIK